MSVFVLPPVSDGRLICPHAVHNPLIRTIGNRGISMLNLLHPNKHTCVCKKIGCFERKLTNIILLSKIVTFRTGFEMNTIEYLKEENNIFLLSAHVRKTVVKNKERSHPDNILSQYPSLSRSILCDLNLS